MYLGWFHVENEWISSYTQRNFGIILRKMMSFSFFPLDRCFSLVLYQRNGFSLITNFEYFFILKWESESLLSKLCQRKVLIYTKRTCGIFLRKMWALTFLFSRELHLIGFVLKKRFSLKILYILSLSLIHKKAYAFFMKGICFSVKPHAFSWKPYISY